MSREELAWAAGFFEGEGTWQLWKNKNRYISNYIGAAVYQNDPEPLFRFQRAVGFGQVLGPYPRPGNRDDQSFWQTGKFEYTQALVAMLWPWLSERRRERAKEMLAHAKNNPVMIRPRDAHGRLMKSVPAV